MLRRAWRSHLEKNATQMAAVCPGGGVTVVGGEEDHQREDERVQREGVPPHQRQRAAHPASATQRHARLRHLLCKRPSRPLLRKSSADHRHVAQNWQSPVVADRGLAGGPYITLTWWMRMYTSGRSRFGARSTVFFTNPSFPSCHCARLLQTQRNSWLARTEHSS